MRKIFGKRTLRELKQNFLRYLALFFLIVLGMYMIVGIVGSAENVIHTVQQGQRQNLVEDGQFTLFVPLTEKEQKSLEKQEITVEAMFYLDYELADGSTLRVFQNREKINRLNLKAGSEAAGKGQIVLEQNYAREHGLTPGGSIELGGEALEVTGTGSSPDYDLVLKEMSDSSADGKLFGTAFVSEDQYRAMKKKGKAVGSEAYVYSFRLNGKLTADELKDQLTDLKVNKEQVKDQYFREMLEDMEETKREIQDGVSKLDEGAESLSSGLSQLDSYSGSLNQSADQLLEAGLTSISLSLKEYGIEQNLSTGNYKRVLNDLMRQVQRLPEGEAVKKKLQAAKDQLQGLEAYRNAVVSYTAGVSEAGKGAAAMADGTGELKKKTDEIIEEYFTVEIGNLTQFIDQKDNPRIAASIDDVMINKYAGTVAGVIIMILFTFVISVFVVHSIERESEMIGTLYALGVRKKTLLAQYLMLPVLITAAGGICGILLGFSPAGIGVMQADSVAYFSFPRIQTVYPAYLLIYGLVMPPLVAVTVNIAVINKKLSRTPLQLLRGIHSEKKVKNIRMAHLGYIRTFQIRQLLREIRPGIALIMGMFICLLILMMGVNCYVICNNLDQQNKQDANYAYMYSLKYPPQTVPEGGEACYMESLKKEAYGYDLDVTLLGIDDDNPYFDAEPEAAKNSVVISSSAAVKFRLEAGDELVLHDEVAKQDYAFTVKEIVPYSIGLHVFMDIDSMRDLFGQEDDYYNVVYANQSLDIDAGRLYAAVSREDIEKSAEIFLEMMMPMVYMMSGVAALIFIVVMYLMMKVVIDRSAHNISLLKIFGYRRREINTLYLNGNLIMTALAALLCVPLSKWVMDAMYPYFISNVSCGMDLTFSWKLYVGIYAGTVLCCFITRALLAGKVSRVRAAEALKNQE